MPIVSNPFKDLIVDEVDGVARFNAVRRDGSIAEQDIHLRLSSPKLQEPSLMTANVLNTFLDKDDETGELFPKLKTRKWGASGNVEDSVIYHGAAQSTLQRKCLGVTDDGDLYIGDSAGKAVRQARLAAGTFALSSDAVTEIASSCQYWKIGNAVYISCSFTWFGRTSLGAIPFSLTGLPFPPTSPGTKFNCAVGGSTSFLNVAAPVMAQVFKQEGIYGNSVIQFCNLITGKTILWDDIRDRPPPGSGEPNGSLYLSGIYITD